VTFNLEVGAAAAAGAFFVLRSVPVLKGLVGLLGTNGNVGKTEVYLEQIARNTGEMRDSLVGLNAKFDAHDRATLDGLKELRDRV
jgi:hypothetical protein